MSETIFASFSFRSVVVSFTKNVVGSFGEEIENALFCTFYVSLNSHATIFIHFLSPILLAKHQIECNDIEGGKEYKEGKQIALVNHSF